MGKIFNRFANAASRYAGHPFAFFLAIAIIVVWAATGPLLHYSDTWQLVINTGTTIVTFLIVFLIQNSQNRESAAVQIKLDELIRATRSARNTLMDLEELSEAELSGILERYREVARKARDPNTPDIGELGRPEVIAEVERSVEAAAQTPPDSPERKEKTRKAAAVAVAEAAETVLDDVQSKRRRRRRTGDSQPKDGGSRRKLSSNPP